MKMPLRVLIFFLLLATCLPKFNVAAAEAKKIVFGYSSIGSMATGVWMAPSLRRREIASSIQAPPRLLSRA